MTSLTNCWNEAMLSSFSRRSCMGACRFYARLFNLIKLNHPYYYEQNRGKEYEYVLAFTADKVEDVTQRYTLKWETMQQRRLTTKIIMQ